MGAAGSLKEGSSRSLRDSSWEVFPFAKKTNKTCIHSGGVVAREEKNRNATDKRDGVRIVASTSSCRHANLNLLLPSLCRHAHWIPQPGLQLHCTHSKVRILAVHVLPFFYKKNHRAHPCYFHTKFVIFSTNKLGFFFKIWNSTFFLQLGGRKNQNLSLNKKKSKKNPYSHFILFFSWRIFASKQPKRNKKEKKKKPAQQIERHFLPVFWEYNQKESEKKKKKKTL